MDLSGICLITDDVLRLADFYKHILNVEPTGNEVHSELDTGVVSMAIYSKAAAIRDMKFDFSRYNGTGIFTLMFEVEDADREYERIKLYVPEFITVPTTYPWGARAFHFRDPDGNIVDFFTPPETA